MRTPLRTLVGNEDTYIIIQDTLNYVLKLLLKFGHLSIQDTFYWSYSDDSTLHPESADLEY